jgi:hypothetical protein
MTVTRLSRILPVLLLPIGSLAAQEAHRAECDSARAAVIGHPLPATGARGWGWWNALRGCGNEGAVTMAEVLQSPAIISETDSVRLGHLFSEYFGVRSTDLYAAYAALAQDSRAALPVRLYSLTALGKLSAPEFDFGGDEFVNPHLTVCPLTFDMVDSSSIGAPLPADYKTEIYATMKALERATAAPAAVRGAAHCWRVRQ